MKTTLFLLLLLPLISMSQKDTIYPMRSEDWKGNGYILTLDSTDTNYGLPLIKYDQRKSFNIIDMTLNDSVIARQRLAWEISANYRQYENKKDMATLWGIVTGLMSPSIPAYHMVHPDDKIGKTFYGIYSGIVIGAATMCIINLVKANKIKNRKFKNK